MRDLIFIAFLAVFMGMGFKRPFLFVLAYAYIDIVSPQRLSYFLLNSIPISLIAFALAVVAWLAVDDKRDSRFTWRQGLMLFLLAYAGYTTLHADFPLEAKEKWDWVWKALVFAIFLPLTLRTKLRIEALSLVMVLCASSIIITGGIKTLLSGGGYGVLNLMVENNSGLYEGSIISTVAIAIIPLILYLSKWSTIFPTDWRVKLFAVGLCFACLLIPIGTEARTGLVCAAFLVLLFLRHSRHRLLYGALLGIAGLMAIPFLPSSFTNRMDTIQNYQADQSASTRIAVWKWTWDYVKDNPLGGGFEAYRQNTLRYDAKKVEGAGPVQEVERQVITDEGRAYHSSYFEMLGEQGFPGLIVWLMLNFGTVLRMEIIRRRYEKRSEEDLRWVAPYALAMQQGHLVYLVGSLFVGIAFQPFIFMLIALQIALDSYLRRREKEAAWQPLKAATPQRLGNPA
ncbi:putative O-glycosylation ligase, exosortase A system-associated [Rhizorhapis suberifaciens]|uniref:Putative O-glycosylation ligase (Exosortase A-associated) n=1 Tax=Rhizorhapis suberifaciens TaxID=13656 RepID=A0A840HT80_9SPHN|nr:putative O-glycosylation ligase, exosortase A system-associated [Rhizorhapis suberifaciens]MBB4640911.1 putative O-glycosylation ligase (exosortase A-associated) [Rhizorhapis suberifaciens]